MKDLAHQTLPITGIPILGDYKDVGIYTLLRNPINFSTFHKLAKSTETHCTFSNNSPFNKNERKKD